MNDAYNESEMEIKEISEEVFKLSFFSPAEGYLLYPNSLLPDSFKSWEEAAIMGLSLKYAPSYKSVSKCTEDLMELLKVPEFFSGKRLSVISQYPHGGVKRYYPTLDGKVLPYSYEGYEECLVTALVVKYLGSESLSVVADVLKYLGAKGYE